MSRTRPGCARVATRSSNSASPARGRRSRRADVVVFLHDLTRLGDAEYEASELPIVERLAIRGASILHVYNKSDAAPAGATAAAAANPGVMISARTGAGLDRLRRELLTRAGWQAQGEGVFVARARHVDALRRARAHVEAADRLAAQGDGALELVAEELRGAHDALGEITGAFSADDLLGAIFSRFCIGK